MLMDYWLPKMVKEITKGMQRINAQELDEVLALEKVQTRMDRFLRFYIRKIELHSITSGIFAQTIMWAVSSELFRQIKWRRGKKARALMVQPFDRNQDGTDRRSTVVTNATHSLHGKQEQDPSMLVLESVTMERLIEEYSEKYADTRIVTALLRDAYGMPNDPDIQGDVYIVALNVRHTLREHFEEWAACEYHIDITEGGELVPIEFDEFPEIEMFKSA